MFDPEGGKGTGRVKGKGRGRPRKVKQGAMVDWDARDAPRPEDVGESVAEGEGTERDRAVRAFDVRAADIWRR
jgi:hypothetical protein